jgi:phosphoribosyl 1,2-cyclic phosphodiesterase
MKLMSIASGSSGNCIMVGTDSTTLLVDAGISKKRIIEGLKAADVNPAEVDGILITHEHMDHVSGLGVFSRAYDVPIYATDATCRQLTYMKKQLGDFDYELFSEVKPDVPFLIGDICITPHAIWHDAVDPVCYTFEGNGKKAAIATDLGDFDDYIIHALKDSDAMLIESNHDVRMLEAGPYPYHLKRRILGKRGHLSNESSGQLIRRLLNNHIHCIMLGHLSEKNNFPELAYATVAGEIMGNEFTNDVQDFNLTVASRDTVGALYEF